MKAKTLLVVVALAGACGCAKSSGPAMARSGDTAPRGGAAAVSPEPAEAGEVKVPLDQLPPAARQTIQRELAGGQLEDIARKQRDGKTVYETDIIRGGSAGAGQKWEVVVAEDGRILSKLQEGSAQERAAD